MLSYVHRITRFIAKGSHGTGVALAVLFLTACGDQGSPVASLGIESPPTSLAFPGYEKVVLQWEVSREPASDGLGTLVFVHLIDERGDLVRTFDHAFPEAWSPGLVVDDEIELFQSALGPPLAAGRYLLTAGLLGSDGQRLRLETDGEDRGRHEYVLSSFEVPSSPPLVEIELEGEWEPVEPGNDRQILGRRWLGRQGRIIVRGGEPGDRVLIWLRIPDASDHQSRFELDEGAGVPEVELSTPCGQETMVVSGLGLHRLEMRLGEKTDGECRLHVSTNFVFEDPTQGGVQRSAVVEVIAHRRR